MYKLNLNSELFHIDKIYLQFEFFQCTFYMYVRFVSVYFFMNSPKCIQSITPKSYRGFYQFKNDQSRE